MKNAFVLTLVTALTLAPAAYAADEAKPDAGVAPSQDYVILKVNGEDIKKSEVEDAWKTIFQGREAPPFDTFDPKMKVKFLREVASEHVLYQEAKKQGLEDSPEVKKSLEEVKRQLVIRQLLEGKTKQDVSDDKLKAAYEARLKAAEADPLTSDEFRARHILVKTKEEAEDIEKKLKKGGDFAKLAKEKSADKGEGVAADGELGWFAADKMGPEFSSALLKLKKGEISAPLKADDGWYIIQLEDRRKITPPPFAEVKETLKQEAGNKAVGEYVKGVMSSVQITQLDAQGHESSIPSVPLDKDKDVSAESPSAGKSSKDAPADQ